MLKKCQSDSDFVPLAQEWKCCQWKCAADLCPLTVQSRDELSGICLEFSWLSIAPKKIGSQWFVLQLYRTDWLSKYYAIVTISWHTFTFLLRTVSVLGKKGTSKIFYFGLEVQFDISDTRVHNRILAHFETDSHASVLVPGNWSFQTVWKSVWYPFRNRFVLMLWIDWSKSGIRCHRSKFLRAREISGSTVPGAAIVIFIRWVEISPMLVTVWQNQCH